jgi:hypothetical protein
MANPDRHKRRLPQTVAVDQPGEVAASSDGATPQLSRLEGLIRICENALSQAQANKDIL